jgi:hypothetical protein
MANRLSMAMLFINDERLMSKLIKIPTEI